MMRRKFCRHRESESRVLVKLVDRGDEIVVDTSELLQLEKRYSTIPAFAQPFRLYNYDESVRLFRLEMKYEIGSFLA
jgi:hypothetical protein